PVTTVAFNLAEQGNVNVSVYNIKGQKVSELTNDFYEAGQHQLIWNAEGKASGVYFVRMHTNGTTQNQKIILMK
ncbi:MAG: T9SS type A sorting domain-containing protein, partial [Candidatus Cloacimonetes bacterium]|nr:T9SS type A sorting domain-containing protein [Candidatus Cloacimonadota bacterium]